MSPFVSELLCALLVCHWRSYLRSKVLCTHIVVMPVEKRTHKVSSMFSNIIFGSSYSYSRENDVSDAE